MNYALRCSKHNKQCSPIYWRPQGKSFIRLPDFLYCPGNDNNPHLCKEAGSNYMRYTVPLDKI